MRRKLIPILLLLSLARAASAHRLDEYLQATLISVSRDRIDLSLRLVPGIAVAPSVIAAIDTDHNGVLSPSEQQAYAQRTLANLSLTLDGATLHPVLVSATFPTLAEMRDGLGEIHIDATAAYPISGTNRTLVLEARNPPPKAVYLVNALVPSDPLIHILAQKRNDLQSSYELDFTQSAPSPSSSFRTSLIQRWTTLRGTVAVLGLASLFHLGIRHIAEGTDHLLFLLVLLLPAPLLAANHRWSAVATVRASLGHILGIVTAFTLGHSVTLALAAFGLVHVPAHPVEVLIAVSILVSAVHALRPIFPGREAAIAAFFGLIHGLAFASTLSGHGLGRWERLAGILSFNLGIETMQLAVVAAILPSLLLLSRTRAYPVFRIAGSLVAAVAAAGWIVERLFNLTSFVDPLVNIAARHALPLAAVLFLLSLACWLLSRVPHISALRDVGSQDAQVYRP
jgi:hypothetical protein